MPTTTTVIVAVLCLLAAQRICALFDIQPEFPPAESPTLEQGLERAAQFTDNRQYELAELQYVSILKAFPDDVSTLQHYGELGLSTHYEIKPTIY
jgi:hypothetical protein